MKIKALTLLLLTAVFFSCKKDPDNNDKNRSGYQIKGEFTPYKFGQADPGGRFTFSISEFNSKGELVRGGKRVGTDKYDGNNSYLDYTNYTYLNDKLTEKKDLLYKYVYTYNNQDTIEIRKYSSTGLSEIEKRTIINSRVVRSDFYLKDNNVVFRTENNTYDDRGLKIRVQILFPPETSFNELLYTHDNFGNILTESYVNNEKKTTVLQAKFGYKYDDRNRVIEYTKNSFYTIRFEKFKNFYDANGRLVRQDLSRSDKFDGVYEDFGRIDYSYTEQ